MKIVYCIPSLYNSGGMERVLSNKANYLADIRGSEVVIITTEQQHRKPFFHFSEKIIFYDLSINYTAIQKYSVLKRFYWELLYKKKHKKKLSCLLKKLHADIVISMFAGEEYFLYRINDGSKKVLEIHFSKYFREQRNRKGIWKGIDWFKSHVDEYIVRQYAAFVVLTNEDKSYWGDWPNIHVIPNGYTKMENGELSNERKKQIVAVGRLVEQKGYDTMTECRRRIGDSVCYATDMYDAALDADALMLVTEWKEFRLPSWVVIKKAMRTPVLLDGRNIYEKKEIEELGFTYHCIGK